MPDSQTVRDDPGVRLAAERTLLAWVRTGLSLMGFGFVVARFGLFLRELASLKPDVPHRPGGMSEWIGVVMVLVGVAALAYGAFDYRAALMRIRQAKPLPVDRGTAGLLLSGVLAVIGLIVAVYLVAITNW